MGFGSKLLSTLVGIVAITAALYVYDRKSNDQLREEFSSNLNKWYEKGNYFTYDGQYRMFYVQDVLVDYSETPSNSNTANTDEKNDSAAKDEVHVVFLHGFPTSSYDYIKLWPLFKQDHEQNNKIKSIVTFDYLGYGFSDKPLEYDYSLFEMADMVDALLMHLSNVQIAYYLIFNQREELKL